MIRYEEESQGELDTADALSAHTDIYWGERSCLDPPDFGTGIAVNSKTCWARDGEHAAASYI
jgi:hypothetical protein